MENLDQIFVQAKRTVMNLAESVLPQPLVLLVSMLISIGVIAAIGPVIMMYLTWLERKVVGRIQNRIGPNRVGKFGLLQPIADGIKMLTKEDIVPEGADHILHFLSPVLVVVPALLVLGLLPWGRNMAAVDLQVGLLLFFAITSTGTLSIFLGAWGSRNKFSLLGALRAVAQLISYEIPQVFSAVVVIMHTQTISIVEIVNAQPGFNWFVFTPWGFTGLVLFYIASVAECNRTPFDLPEAESEIVAGFHTEYSGMKFALFYMAEFLQVFSLSALAAALFLGGWQGPFLPSWIWFFLKTYGLIFIMLWFRGTFPRLRVDQLMGFAWKFLLPMSMINIVVVGIWTYASPIVAWVLGILIIAISFGVLAKLNTRYHIERNRKFILAE
ncbi:MAG: NADH-quinone oxidoreductase subunit NuoH [Candidatus Omnitrophica bacterium]|nr:NADH-quinone oxidoreductase subunit NuoH [Candidatus Omnitrophota bacterium]